MNFFDIAIPVLLCCIICAITFIITTEYVKSKLERFKNEFWIQSIAILNEQEPKDDDDIDFIDADC
jgi:hypothetical protein